MTGRYAVHSSHLERQCHSETCCCDTDYVIISKEKGHNQIISEVNSEEEGKTIINLLEKN